MTDRSTLGSSLLAATLAAVFVGCSRITTGTVAFNSDRSTQVIAPISGPVSRILVSPGARVERGQPLAIVSSPDFAQAVGDLVRYLGSVQPSEGQPDDQLLNHGWILGDTTRITWAQQADLDLLLEPRHPGASGRILGAATPHDGQ